VKFDDKILTVRGQDRYDGCSRMESGPTGFRPDRAIKSRYSSGVVTYLLTCARLSSKTEYGGCFRCVLNAIWLDAVPEGMNIAASFPVILAMCASSALLFSR
jgi:hypothetical protein